MTSRDFCFWLQGYLEISDAVTDGTRGFSTTTFNEGQLSCVRKHLALVFVHEIDPSFGDKEKQDLLKTIHQGALGGLDVKFNC